NNNPYSGGRFVYSNNGNNFGQLLSNTGTRSAIVMTWRLQPNCRPRMKSQNPQLWRCLAPDSSELLHSYGDAEKLNLTMERIMRRKNDETPLSNLTAHRPVDLSLSGQRTYHAS